jgi:hypothetical protein
VPAAGYRQRRWRLKVTSVGNTEVKGSLNLAGRLVSWSATWKVVAAGPDEIELQLASSNGLPSGLASKAQCQSGRAAEEPRAGS